MSRATQKNLIAAVVALALILCAMSIRYCTMNDLLPSGFGHVREAIHIFLLLGWGYSVQKRIIQTQVRQYLLAIAALMTLWLVLKTVNYSIDNMDIKCWLWYLYYIPMLFIPADALFVSMSLGKSENYQPPHWARLVYVVSSVLFLLVITNDLHHLVFSFSSGVRSPIEYHHEIGYYIILAWIFLCALAAFGMMLIKCRIPGSKKIRIMPLVPLLLSFIYTFLYIRRVHLVLLLAGDMTVTHCLLIAAIFEGCIQCGLIQSNMDYSELFAATTIPIQITNDDFYMTQASAAMQDILGKNVLENMPSDTIRMGSDTLLKRHSLDDGWVFWKEDISELNKLKRELEITQDELRDTGNVLAAENAQRAKLLRLSEENRLYDMMESQTAHQIAMLRARLTEIRQTDDLARARRLLGQAIVIGTYIKRRNNLIFVGAQHGVISAQELRLCLNESMENLNLYGVECRTLVDGEEALAVEQATQVYDLFEAVVEAELETLESILISIEIGEFIEVNICFQSSGCEPQCESQCEPQCESQCEPQADRIKAQFPASEWSRDEDGLQYITWRVRKADAAGSTASENLTTGGMAYEQS